MIYSMLKQVPEECSIVCLTYVFEFMLQKPLAMGRSPIDRCGLFATERIEQGDLVSEK